MVILGLYPKLSVFYKTLVLMNNYFVHGVKSDVMHRDGLKRIMLFLKLITNSFSL